MWWQNGSGNSPLDSKTPPKGMLLLYSTALSSHDPTLLDLNLNSHYVPINNPVATYYLMLIAATNLEETLDLQQKCAEYNGVRL